MKWYYTSSAGKDTVQTDIKLSLGGYKSSSLLSNDTFGGLFEEITTFLLSREFEKEYIGIIVENDLATDIENLWLWFEYSLDSYSKFLVAAVDLVADSNGVLAMERITSKNSKPLYADFHEANGIQNAVEIGNILAGGSIGLWFCRELAVGLLTLVNEDSNFYTVDPSNEDLVIAATSLKSDIVLIKLNYGSEYYGGPIGNELV